MADILEQIIREQQHEKAVKSFLNSVDVSAKYIHYDNFKTFANAKNTMKFNTITQRDVLVLNKFCKRWIQLKGEVDAVYLRRIQSTIKYYANKEHNYKCKQRRLQTRAVKKTVLQA